MSDRTEQIHVHPAHLEAFQCHIDTAITVGTRAEKESVNFSGDLLEEAEEQMHLAHLMRQVKREDSEENPTGEPTFSGPVEAMKDLADSMARDFSDDLRGLTDWPVSSVDVRIARHKLDDLESWLETLEALTVAEAVC